jgi:undecaprenyl-diphosphatase
MEQKKRILIYVISGIGVSFIILTIFISFFPQSYIDIKFSHEVQEHENPTLDKLMEWISWFGYYPGSVLTVVIPALILLVFRYFKEALFAVLSTVSNLVDSAIKLLINRPRPSDKLVRIVQKVQQQSFPSGHVVFYVVFFGFLLVLMYKLKTIPAAIRVLVSCFASFLIVTVPISRVYLGAHWFTDVLGGFLLGLTCLFAISYLYLYKEPAH